MTRALRILTLALVLTSTSVSVSRAQAAPPKFEFRGAWIATVANLDWPSSPGLSTAVQQAQLIEQLDKLKAAGINAVVFQVRDESDALYESTYEPWSYFLTGMQGVAPDPYYDPLEFAIEEAHKRGMELHAWFNPYRVWVSSRNYQRDPSSVYLSRPEWLLTTDDVVTILNPGIPDAQSYVVDVIRDVVTRYDVDGVHFDDYFYPYPPNQIVSEDYATYQEYGGAFSSLAEWRTDNVNTLVRGVWEMIQAEAPDVKFGISPFGIWKNGVPYGIQGLDAANVLFADAVQWMDNGWLDYLTPQLYWPFGGGQDYGKLAPWWADQVNGRHLYPGHALYRSTWSPSEVPNQVRFNRDHGIPGSVFFRSGYISSKGFADTLRTDLYRHPALTPIMPWKDTVSPGTPTDLLAANVGTEVTLSWTPPVPDGFAVDPRFYSIYRYRGVAEPDWDTLFNDPSYLVALIGDTTWVDNPEDSDVPYWYTVRAVSSNSIESDAVAGASVIATGVESELPLAFSMDAAFPNPFRTSTTVRYAVPGAGRVSISVYDALGREVARLVDDDLQPSSIHEATWNAASSGAATGTYFVVMRFEGKVESRGVVFLR